MFQTFTLAVRVTIAPLPIYRRAIKIGSGVTVIKIINIVFGGNTLIKSFGNTSLIVSTQKRLYSKLQ